MEFIGKLVAQNRFISTISSHMYYSVWHWYIGAKYQLRLTLQYSLALVSNFAIENHAVYTRIAHRTRRTCACKSAEIYYANIPMYFSMFRFTPLDIDAVDAVASILPWAMSMSSRKLHPPPATQFSFIQYRKYTSASTSHWKEKEMDSKRVVDIVYKEKWDSAKVDLCLFITLKLWLAFKSVMNK